MALGLLQQTLAQTIKIESFGGAHKQPVIASEARQSMDRFVPRDDGEGVR